MAGVALDEDAVDEVLYLARANEASELESYMTELSAQQSKHSKAELLAAAVDPRSKNSALHYAAANGHIDVIKLISSYISDKASPPGPGLVNTVNDAGNTPLHWAALNGHLECVKLLIQLGADVTIINQAGHDAVFEAELNDKKEVVDWLLGAVEGLEKGIGGTEESEDGAQAHDEADSSSGVGEGGAAGVEDMRRQMEGMDTNKNTSQSG